MEDQDKLMKEIDIEISIGTDIEGIVLSKTSDGIIISLKGYGFDGIIPKKELSNSDEVETVYNTLNKNDTIKARVIKYKNTDGYVVLSRYEIEKESIFDELENIYKQNQIITLKVVEEKEKGIVGYYKGVRIFIPSSQIDTRYSSKKKSLINTEIKIKLIDFNRNNVTRIIGSRKVVIEEEKTNIENTTWDKLKIGDIVNAEIKRFTKFGAFADVSGVDGLIHLSQISWGHVIKPQDLLKIGDKVNVKIIDLDKENKKLSLSIKETTSEPWQNIYEKYPEGTTVLGKVVRINDFGVFVELEAGVDALVHISKISHDRINHPSEVVKIGDEIKAKIISVDKEKKRIGLSIKDIL